MAGSTGIVVVGGIGGMLLVPAITAAGLSTGVAEAVLGADTDGHVAVVVPARAEEEMELDPLEDLLV